MNILWLSWRDIKNPQAGGAERVAIEIARRFVGENHKVYIFSANFKNAKHKQNIGGINIIRRGNRLTCRIHAFFFYISNKNRFDLVIDEINTLPFFSPLYANGKNITIIHQLAREYWFTQVIWPLSLIGYVLEPIYLRLYRHTPTIVISPSTQKDLTKLGFKNTFVTKPGINIKSTFPSKKADLILFIGRLTRAKQVVDAIRAFKLIVNILPSYRLLVIGRGDQKYTQELKSLTQKLKLQQSVKFTGFITENLKVSLLKKTKIVMIPSLREGWNLVATEANATGAVPIAYNVPGLRDSIKNGQTGLLVKPNHQELARSTLSLLKNEQTRYKIARRGYNWSKNFDWENCYKDFKQIIAWSRPA